MPLAGKEARIALLIDADNAPAAKIDEILTELSTLGVINIRRAYGNWTKAGLEAWQDKLLEFAIRPIQQFDYSKRKNATDMAMTVDAMDLFYADGPDAFGIVSSDADFTPLVMHLRAKGAAVYGFGAAQTPRPFVNACSRFLYLEALGVISGVVAPTPVEVPTPFVPTVAPDAPAGAASWVDEAALAVAASAIALPLPVMASRPPTLRRSTAELRQDARLLTLLRDAVNASQEEGGWAKVGAVGTQIANKTSFDARNYGYATLSKLLGATEAFDMRDEGTPRVAVRDRHADAKDASA
ncbi:MAG: NYN domain-containing protein [Comamonadaceae bacterium]|nr:MAG: NYN domain-containing protein [Comamonadaceae bacterium]